MSVHGDWLSLVHLSGLVVSEPVLDERFPDGPLPIPGRTHNWFRRRAERYRIARQAENETGVREWIDFMLEGLLELPGQHWLKHHDVPDAGRTWLDEFEQELRADRVLTNGKDVALLVSIVPPSQGLDRRDLTPGKWKASPTTKLERLMRATENPLGLVTNGDAFRLIYAPVGLNTGHITWTSRLLIEEKVTLDAFRMLLGKELLLPEGEDSCLADMCELSLKRQGEVADQLGEQVRNGLERLIWAWDALDRESQGQLLKDVSDEQLYEMGLVVMMRLVFLLYAEERSLLPHGEVLYDQGYGLTYLWHRLQDQHRTEQARLQDTHDGWDRFLATCRMVHHGTRHPDLSLIAYGGSLFDPERFEALESEACRVSNETMYNVLKLLLFARQRRGGELQRVGYWSLGIEQLGYVYEGLLDHVAATATDVPVVKLRGAGEASLPITELESREGEDLVKFIAKETGRKPEAIEEALKTRSDADLEELKRYPPDTNRRVAPFAGVIQVREVAPPGWRYMTTGLSRRQTGAHYTPQELTERIVRVTLEPLTFEGDHGKLTQPMKVRSPREILSLKVCDPAMGSGAFLVQAVRYLGDRLVEAWDRALADAGEDAVLSMPYAEPVTDAEAQRPIPADDREEMNLWARRFVAERCIYGVDKNPLAVEMAKLSLWLTTLAKDKPFTFLDHALRCGDSLLGVDLKQLRSWSLTPGEAVMPILDTLVREAVDRAVDLRLQIQSIPVVHLEDRSRKAKLLEEADRAMDTARLAGDLLIAPVFSNLKAKKLEKLQSDLMMQFSQVASQKLQAETVREGVQSYLLEQRPFHWPLEFPEVFLEGEREGFDAFVGNPPFMGGKKISGAFGKPYREHLVSALAVGTKGHADLVAYFFLRVHSLLKQGGGFGLLATNTIAQGDTREVGLDRIMATGSRIHTAERSMPWPGAASLEVAVVHVSRGGWKGPYSLDGSTVPRVTAYLDESESQGKPFRLVQNKDKSFQGSIVLGMGFVLEPEEAQALIDKDPRNRDVLFPYLNGKDLNSRPDQSPSRWVINFHDWPIERAREYPDCFRIIEEKVKPERTRKKPNGKFVLRKPLPQRWWIYADKRPLLYHTIEPLERVLVVARVSRTLAFTFVPQDWVYNEKTVVFGSDAAWYFAILQSSVHEPWAWHYSSTLKTDLNYTPSDCFETFPFPQNLTDDQRAVLDRLGEEYHEHRRQVMLDRQLGLTKTYNLFHDPHCISGDIVKLRNLHEDMDQAVLTAYDWNDIDLGHGYHGEGKQCRFTISEEARREVLSRLLALNHEIHEREVEEGLVTKGKSGRKTKKKSKKTKESKAQGLLALPATEASSRGPETTRAPAEPRKVAEPRTQYQATDAPSQILSWLKSNPGWHGKSEVIEGSGCNPKEWLKAIKALLDEGRIEKKGQRRGTKYRAS